MKSNFAWFCYLILQTAVPASAQVVSLSFDVLPKKAEINTLNWSSSFWPNALGGLLHRHQNCSSSLDCLSPAEKLDLITGTTHYTEFAAEYQRSAGSLAKYWQGFCDSISALQASFPQIELQPTLYPTKHGQLLTLYPSDLVAMAALAVRLDQVSRDEPTIWGNRCISSRFSLRNDPKCDDLPAIGFHQLLQNYTAQGKFLIADIAPYAWINNQVITGYELKTISETGNQVRIKAILSFRKIYYSIQEDIRRSETLRREYEYELTLNSDRTVQSARWTDEKAKPDFFWKMQIHRFNNDFIFLNKFFPVNYSTEFK